MVLSLRLWTPGRGPLRINPGLDGADTPLAASMSTQTLDAWVDALSTVSTTRERFLTLQDEGSPGVMWPPRIFALCHRQEPPVLSLNATTSLLTGLNGGDSLRINHGLGLMCSHVQTPAGPESYRKKDVSLTLEKTVQEDDYCEFGGYAWTEMRVFLGSGGEERLSKAAPFRISSDADISIFGCGTVFVGLPALHETGARLLLIDRGSIREIESPAYAGFHWISMRGRSAVILGESPWDTMYDIVGDRIYEFASWHDILVIDLLPSRIRARRLELDHYRRWVRAYLTESSVVVVDASGSEWRVKRSRLAGRSHSLKIRTRYESSPQ